MESARWFPSSPVRIQKSLRVTLAERIWEAVRRVPAGFVATYGDIARAVQPRCSPRQVGWALRRAPHGLGLPWHRILAAGGRIALPGEAGLEQRMRLETEGVRFAGRRVRMEEHRYREL